MTLLPRAYLTPVFDSDDPIIGREMYLRPSLWAVVFGHLGLLTNSWAWRQSEDPTGATVQDVTAEIEAELLRVEFTHMYIGEMRPFATAAPPAGWLRCDGTIYENIDYPELAAAIHAGYVVDADHFRVPDGTRRAFIDGVAVGVHEGSEMHTNTEAEMFQHAHEYEKTVAAASTVLGELPGIELGAYSTELTNFFGEGEPYSILNPVEGTQWYIRAAWPTAGGA